MVAAEKGDAGILEVMNENNQIPNAQYTNVQNIEGDTALHLVVKNEHVIVVELLVSPEYGGNPFQKNIVGTSPFDIAIEKKYENIQEKINYFKNKGFLNAYQRDFLIESPNN